MIGWGFVLYLLSFIFPTDKMAQLLYGLHLAATGYANVKKPDDI